MNPQKVIDESRPMIEEFLSDIGIYRRPDPIANEPLLNKFSSWIDAQQVSEEDFLYLASRVAAFICEYLIEARGAVRHIEGQRILLRLPVDASHGVYKEFDPYGAAVDVVRQRQSLKQFLDILTS